MSKAAAKRYAKALFEIANDDAKRTALNTEFLEVKSVFAQNKDLQLAVKNPIVAEDVKQSIVTSVFSSASEQLRNLFVVLGANKRIAIVEHIASAYVSLYEKSKNIQRATVVTAVDLDSAMETKVQQKVKELTGYEALLTSKVDASILGGFVLRIDDMQFDASISGSLQSVKRKLV